MILISDSLGIDQLLSIIIVGVGQTAIIMAFILGIPALIFIIITMALELVDIGVIGRMILGMDIMAIGATPIGDAVITLIIMVGTTILFAIMFG